MLNKSNKLITYCTTISFKNSYISYQIMDSFYLSLLLKETGKTLGNTGHRAIVRLLLGQVPGFKKSGGVRDFTPDHTNPIIIFATCTSF